jgi:hypothetical protein
MDSIFSEDELKAQEAAPDAEIEQHEPAEQGGQDRPRGPDGKFLPKEDPDASGDEEGKEKGGTVPQQALHAEREKRKAAEDRERSKDDELAKVREQLDAIAKMREQVAARKPADLPAADDPAALEHLRTRLNEVEQGQTRMSQHMDDTALAQREVQELGNVMVQSEARYRQEKPDYDDAINHVIHMRANELALYGLAPAQIQQTIAEEATEIIRSAVQQGRDPAELGYQIALSRGYQIALSRGYRPAEGDGKTEAKPNGGAQATIDAIARAKASGKSLGAGGGGSPKTLTAEALAALSDDEFEAIYSTPEGKAMIDAL